MSINYLAGEKALEEVARFGGSRATVEVTDCPACNGKGGQCKTCGGPGKIVKQSGPVRGTR